jgi:hypothetical protein
MRLIAWALIIVSLVVSIVSAVTAYSPSTSLPDARFATRADDGTNEPLALGAPAGRAVVDGKEQPIADAGAKLSPELLARLRASEQRRVRVSEFSFARWGEWWLFALGCAGMLGGAMLIRRADARELAAVGATRPETGGGGGGGADAYLRSLRTEVEQLRRDVSAAHDPTRRNELIVERAERIISERVPPFLDARPQLVARLGLAGYAQLMDRFAAGERQLNRAWSAAADGYEEEAVACLNNASALLEEAEQRMT